MPTKIPVTHIALLFSESPALVNQSFTSWYAANRAILKVSTTMSTLQGAYKTDFHITFADGFLYNGRIDVTPDVYDLAQHIQDFCAFHAGTKKPTHLSLEQYHSYLQSLHTIHPHLTQDYQQILATYLFDDIPPVVHPIAI